jgi:hypothetical protein
MGFDDDGDPPAGRTEQADDTGDDRMDFEETTEEFVKNLEKNAASSLQKESAESARTSTSTSTSTTATGMKKIEEEDEEEEEEELGMKTRNWRKINLSFTIELGELGEDGDDETPSNHVKDC